HYWAHLKRPILFEQTPISLHPRFFHPSSSSAFCFLCESVLRSITPPPGSVALCFPVRKMGDKRKKTFMFIRLVSAAGTGFFYVKRKSSKGLVEKLEFRKYDPRVNRHVLFTEQKMK
ncbi:unnamed protein product, partial [Thlaspi arvense]